MNCESNKKIKMEKAFADKVLVLAEIVSPGIAAPLPAKRSYNVCKTTTGLNKLFIGTDPVTLECIIEQLKTDDILSFLGMGASDYSALSPKRQGIIAEHVYELVLYGTVIELCGSHLAIFQDVASQVANEGNGGTDPFAQVTNFLLRNTDTMEQFSKMSTEDATRIFNGLQRVIPDVVEGVKQNSKELVELVKDGCFDNIKEFEQELKSIESGDHSDTVKWEMMKGKVEDLLSSLGSSSDSLEDVKCLLKTLQSSMAS